MWNDVKDLLNSRLEKLSTGCKLHALFDKITEINSTVSRCVQSIGTLTFEDLKSLDEDKKTFYKIENQVKSLTLQLEEIKVQYSLLNNQVSRSCSVFPLSNNYSKLFFTRNYLNYENIHLRNFDL